MRLTSFQSLITRAAGTGFPRTSTIRKSTSTSTLEFPSKTLAEIAPDPRRSSVATFAVGRETACNPCISIALRLAETV